MIPIKLSTIDHHTSDCGTVTANPFCGGMDDDVCAPLNRPAHIWSSKRVIDDEGNMVVVGYFRYRFNIQNVETWIPDCLCEYRFGF